MNKAKTLRLSKPTLFIVMLVALTLIFGMLATSMIVAEAYTITLPNVEHWANAPSLQAGNWKQQSSISATLDTTDIESAISSFGLPASNSSTNQNNQFTVVKDSNSGYFYGHNSWNIQSSPTTLTSGTQYHFGVFYMMYASADLIGALRNGGNIKVTASGSVNALQGTLNAYAYVGLMNNPVPLFSDYTQIENAGGVGEATTVTASGSFTAEVESSSVITAVPAVSSTPDLPSTYTANTSLDTAVGILVGIFIDLTPSANGTMNVSNLDFAIDVPNTMSLPQGNIGQKTGNFTMNNIQQDVLQDNVTAIEDLSSSTFTSSNFTIVDNTRYLASVYNGGTNTDNDNAAVSLSYDIVGGGHANSTDKNGWSYTDSNTSNAAPAHSAILYHIGFIHTYSLSKGIYDAIYNGAINVSLEAAGTLTMTSFDSRVFAYVGIGTASSDEAAKNLAGLNETAYAMNPKAVAGTNTGIYDSESGLNASLNSTTSGQGFTQVRAANEDDTNYYLRVAFYAEPWVGSSGTSALSIEGVTMSLTLTEVTYPMSTPTDPQDNYTISMDYYKGKETNSDTNFLQPDIPTISSTIYSATVTDFSTADDTAAGWFTDNGNRWERSMGTDGTASTSTTINSCLFFYTFELDDSVYEALLNGTSIVSLSGISYGGSSSSTGDWYSYLYLGIGYATSSGDVRYVKDFNEIKGVIATDGSNATKFENKSYDTSANPGAISDFNMSSSSLTNGKITDNSNENSGTKYLRIGMYSRMWNYSGDNFSVRLDSLTLTLSEPVIPGNIMSNPGTVFATSNNDGGANGSYAGTGDGDQIYYGWHSLKDTMVENKLQDAVDTITATGTYTRNSYHDFTLVSDTQGTDDNEDSHFLMASPNPGWHRTTTTTQYMDNVIFMVTYKLSDSIYQGIIDGTYYVTLTGSAKAGVTAGGGDVDNWLYVGLGNAASESVAMSYSGFKETSSIIGARYNQSSSTYYGTTTVNSIDSRSSITSDIKTGASQSLAEAYSSGTKYLRVAMFGEVWSGSESSSRTSKLDTVSLTLNINAYGAGSNANASSSYYNNMTKPSGSDNNTSFSFGTTSFYDAANPSSNTYMRAQESMYTISNSGKTLTSSGSYFATESGTNNVYQSGWGTSSSSSGDYVFTSITNYSNLGSSQGFEGGYHLYFDHTGTTALAGMFYTLKLSENVYNALMAGKITVTFESPGTSAADLGSDGTGHVMMFSYLGIGYATSDDYAKQGNAFNEIKGYVHSQARDIYASGGGTNEAAGINNITNFSFASVSTNSSYTGTSSAKYLRFGLWAVITTGGSSCSNMHVTYGTYNLRLTPDANATAPSYSGYISANNTYYANAPITISDDTGLDYYTVSDGSTSKTVEVAKYSNTANVTSAFVEGAVNGTSYTVTAYDLWGNSSSFTFTYFKPVIKVTGYTDDVLNDYGGGGIGLSNGSSSGEGDTYTYLYQAATYGDTIYVHAKPNEGYYFAGFTIDTIFTTAYSLSFSTSGAYAEIDTTNLEYTYSFAISGIATVPTDGVIGVQAYFKKIETSGAGTYTYSKEERPLEITATLENKPFGTEDMTSSIVYEGGSAPVNVGEYAVTTTVFWNSLAVGKKIETVTINQKDITASFSVVEGSESKTYDGDTETVDDEGNAMVTYTLNDIIEADRSDLFLAYSAVFNSKDAGSQGITIDSLVFTGNTVDGYDMSLNYNLTTTDDTSLTATINQRAVSVVFTTTGKIYDGEVTATVNEPTVTGMVGSESISYNLAATYADKNAGEDKPVTLSDASAVAGADTLLSNYAITTNADSLTATIAQKAMTIGYSVTESKVYDGTDIAEVSGITVSDIIEADRENLVASVTATYDNLNVGEGKTIYVNIALSGTESGNYSYTSAATLDTGVISARAVTLTASSYTKVYGDEDIAEADLEYTLTSGSFANDEDLEAMAITPYLLNKVEAVGTYTVAIRLNANSNYSVTIVEGTYDITARTLNATFTVQGEKTYDGGSDVTEYIAYELGNYYGTDNEGLTLKGVSASVAAPDAGTREVTVASGITLENKLGYDLAKNYSLNIIATGLTLKINPALLTVTLGYEAKVITYGELPTLKVSYSGFVASESEDTIIATAPALELIADNVLNANGYINAGTYENLYTAGAIKPATVNGGNYELAYVCDTLTVNKGTLIGVFIGLNTPSTDLSYTATYTGAEFTLNVGYTGFVAGEDESVIKNGEGASVSIVSANASAYPNAGTYSARYVQGTAEADNYDITVGEDISFTIEKVSLTVTYAGEEIDFGAAPQFTLTYEGFVADEDEEVFTTAPTVNTSSLSYTTLNGTKYVTAGSYELTPEGGSATNYTFDSCVKGTLTVNKLGITLTYVEKGSDGLGIYYGTAPSTDLSDEDKFSVAGLIEDDDVSSLGVELINLPTAASTEAYTLTSESFVLTATNYYLSDTSSGTLLIRKAILKTSLKATSNLAVYGDLSVFEAITVEYTGFVYNEDASVLKAPATFEFASLKNDSGYIDVGSHEVSASGGEADNYELDYSSKLILVVTEATLTIAYPNDGKVYDGKAPTVSNDKIELSGYADGEEDFVRSELKLDSITLAVTPNKATVGTYSVTPLVTDNLANYKFSVVSGAYTVSAREIEITVADRSSVYGEEIAFDLDGWSVTSEAKIVEGDTLEVVITKEEGTAKGTYALTGALKEADVNANYSVSFVHGTYTVSAREVVISLLGQTSVYGEAITVSQTDYEVSADKYSVLGGDEINLVITKEKGTAVGSYALSATYSNDNYAITINGASYVITPATLSVSISFKYASIKQSELEKLTAGDFSVSYSGFVLGDSADSALGTAVEVDLAAVKALPIGTSAIPYIAGSAANYTLDYSGIGNMIIAMDLIEITPENYTFENATYIYDGSSKSIVFVWESKPEYVSITYNYIAGNTANSAEHKNADTYTVEAMLQSTDAAYTMAEGYSKLSVTMIIAPKEIVVTLGNQSSVYGEAIVVDDSAYSTEAGAVVEGDELNVDISVEAADKYTVGGYALSATYSNANYSVSFAEGVYSVTERAITLKAHDISAIYGDAIELDNAEWSVTGDTEAVSGDDLGVTVSIEEATAYGVGSYALYISATNPNYSFSYVEGVYTVSKRSVGITLRAQTAVYGDLITIDQTAFDITSGSLVGSDTLTPVIVVEQAEKYLAGSSYALSATCASDNYEVAITPAELGITQRRVTLKLLDQTSVYGEQIAIDSSKYQEVSGTLIEGDELNIVITKQGTSVNAGSYPLSATYSNANYVITFQAGNYVITKAATEIYFDKMITEVEYTGSDIAITPSLFYVYTNRENATANIAYPTDVLKEVGEYTLTFSVGPQTPDNYETASASVKVSVVKATPKIDFSAIAQSTYVYNGSEQHITGATHNNTDEGVEVSYLNNTFTDVPEGGQIKITVSLSETKNYKATSADYVVTVLKAEYDLTGYTFESKSLSYNGEEHYLEVVGLPESIAVEYAYEGVTQAEPIGFKNAGVYTVSANYTYDSRNYLRPVFIESARLTIDRVNITVEVVNQDGIYGDEPSFDPEGVKVIAGNFIEGDVIDLELKLEPKDSYPIGNYQLIASTTSSGNYNVSVASGIYTILPRPITITIDDKESEYGDDDLPLTYTVTEGSLVNNDTLIAALIREEGNTLGEYTIGGTVVNPNYEVTVIAGKYTIVPRKISIVLYPQEGTKASHINKKGYKISGGVLRGDNLDIQVVPEGEIDGTPGEYPLTATYADNPNYEITVIGAKFTLRNATRITVVNPLESKLYDGKPYSYDVIVSSGATPQFSINGIFVENSFTEVGIYEITVTAPVYGEYAEPDPYTFTLEIRPTELVCEQSGITFLVSKEGGFGADESLDVHQTQEIVLSGKDYTQEIDSAYSIYIVKGEERISLEEYMQGEGVTLKIKLNSELQSIGVSTWFVDNDANVLQEVGEADENGYIEVELVGGNHVLFVASREEAAPILIAAGGLVFAFVILFFFYLFRKKAL